ncbi:MAG: Calx-beta domain-containing protein, partial [Chloroflexota bacterium]
TGRHGGGAVVWNHEIYAAAGSSQQGESEINSQEKLALAAATPYVVDPPAPTSTPTPVSSATPEPTPTATPIVVPTADPNEELPVITVEDVTVAEGDTSDTAVEVVISIDKAFGVPVVVNYQTTDGTAVSQPLTGRDYVPASGSIVIPAGEQSFTLELTVVGDETEEADETFRLTLSQPQNATIGDSKAIITITNDDADQTVGQMDNVIYLPLVTQP